MSERNGFMEREVQSWTGNGRGDFFAGLVSAFAVLPEVIGFTIVAGVDPVLGLYTSVIFLLLLSVLGGRPAMVSAGAGSMAVLVAPLIADHGLDYMFAAVLIAGAIQLFLGLIGIGKLMRRIPQSVISGFVDGLAFIILMSQITTFSENCGDTMLSISLMVGFIAVGLAVIFLFPRITKAVPSTLIAIVTVTVLSVVINAVFGLSGESRTIGDLGDLTGGWPGLGIPAVLSDASALGVILPYAVSLAFVGLLETSLTAQVVDKMTATPSDDRRECCAQGISNFVCGSVGAMPGCAMIGQAVACVKSGGRGRLSTMVSGLVLVLLIAFGSDLLGIIPLAALIAVMLFVCVSTFDWTKFSQDIRARDRNAICAAGMTLITFIAVALTRNLAIGAVAGLSLALLFWLVFGKDRTFRIA